MGALFATFGINGKLLLAQMINFGLLLAILWYFLYRPILRVIDERRNKIAESVRVANAAQAKLEDAKKESERIVGDAGKQAEGLVAAARERAEEKGGEMVKAAQEKSNAMLAEAAVRAEEAKRKAVAESEREIARAAMLAAERIMRQKSA